MNQLSKQELTSRIEKLHKALKNKGDNWDYIFITDKINQYYFTGTMQDGVFVITNAGDFLYFVRRSLKRAEDESPLKEHLYPMVSYGDIQNKLGRNTRPIYLETEITTCAALERTGRYFDVTGSNIIPADMLIKKIRAVKSPYELSMMTESGRQHKILMEDIIPSLLTEGMNEAELCGKLYERMIELGYHGVARFGKLQTEMAVGQLGFGENSAYPTNFDGPGGMRGMSPAVPLVGDRSRKLKGGDLVFIDIGYGVNGYHSDRTQVYMFGANPPEEAVLYHRKCMEIQKKAAGLLKPGNIPGEIYNTSVSGLDDVFLSGFMGSGNDRVKFIGHGIGLQVDEYPVIAQKFNEPLVENTVISLEPKRSIIGFGTVGVEDTYIVTPDGGKCITGGEKDIIVI